MNKAQQYWKVGRMVGEKGDLPKEKKNQNMNLMSVFKM